MEVTHGQWLVRNFLIHDNVSGMLALERREDLQIAIEEQQKMGLDGLSEEDRYLMEINLDDLETTSGEYQAVNRQPSPVVPTATLFGSALGV